MAILRTALVGLKGMGRQHLKGLSTSPRAELTAVADIDTDDGGTVDEGTVEEWKKVTRISSDSGQSWSR